MKHLMEFEMKDTQEKIKHGDTEAQREKEIKGRFAENRLIGWILTPIGNVTTFPLQRVPGVDDDITYIDIAAIDRLTKEISKPQYLIGKDAPSRARKIIAPNSVLVSMTRPNLNAVATAGPEYWNAFASTGLDVLVCSPAINQRYLFYYVRSRDFIDHVSSLVQGALYPAVSSRDIRDTLIPLPPLPEQERIAARLDLLLGRLKAARKRLDAVPELLKRFRKSVLAMAVSGRLTEEWRAEHAAELSSAEIASVECLPNSWAWEKIGDVGEVQLGRQRAPKYHTGSSMRPYLRVQNVFEDYIDLADVKEMNFPGNDTAKYELKQGDILLNEGQSPELLGRPAIYMGELPGVCFTNTLIRFQAGVRIIPRFCLHLFRHYMHSGIFKSQGTITTNIAHLGAGRFANLGIQIGRAHV